MTSTTPAPPAGWYPDSLPGRLRWFDGATWSADTMPAPGPDAEGAAQERAARFAVPVPATQALLAHPQARPAVGATPSDPVHWLLPTGRSGVSIAAGYVALFAMFVWVLGPVALLLGVLAVRAGARGGNGKGRAWFAVVVGVLSTLAAGAVGISML